MEPQKDTVKDDLLKTFEVLKIREVPALVEEILHFFISSSKESQTGNNLIVSKLKEMESAGKIFTDAEGFVSLSENITQEIHKRTHLEEITREKAKYAQKILSGLQKIPFVKFVGVIGEAPLGRIGEGEKVKLVVVTERETAHLSKFLIETYLKFRSAFNHFHIQHITEVNNLKWFSTDAESGIKLLKMFSFVNKDKIYENFMAANNWIFEIFTNYPLEKVSWGFRVSKDIERNVPPFYKMLNSFFKPKNRS